MVTADLAVRDKRFNCGAVFTVIKTYRYMVYVKIFVSVNCGAVRFITFKALMALGL